MNNKLLVLIAGIGLSVLFTCAKAEKKEADKLLDSPVIFKQEKQAIIKTLNDETKAAFQRDYESWKDKWVHDSDITKIYINFADSSFSESLGWEEINGFVKNYFEAHPDPEPVPAPLDDINVRLYENGAWVTYNQYDSIRGVKRETRLMEKVEGEWKIAGMQTTIYGLKQPE